jgi:hypothetical protein
VAPLPLKIEAVTATTDLAPALAALSPAQLRSALVRRFMRATIGGLNTPVVTEYPVAAARTVMSLVLSVTGLEDEDGDGCEQWPPGEGPIMGLGTEDERVLVEQARADQRQRDILYLRAAAHRAGESLIPAHALFAAADLLAAAPIND